MKGIPDRGNEGVKFSAEQTREEVRKILAQLEAETPLGNPASGLRCPKCGGQLVHTRLYGYRCIRGC